MVNNPTLIAQINKSNPSYLYDGNGNNFSPDVTALQKQLNQAYSSNNTTPGRATNFSPTLTAAIDELNQAYSSNDTTPKRAVIQNKVNPSYYSLDYLFSGSNKPTNGTTTSSLPSTTTTNSGGTGNGWVTMAQIGNNLNNSINGTNNTVPTGNTTTPTTTGQTQSTTQTLADLYNGNNYAVNGGTLDFSMLQNSGQGPNSPTSPGYLNTAAPNLSDMYSKMYQNTFTNPQAYWNEYSQGQGAAMTDAAARAMAKSGHTGLMPTLQTQAYQDYMSNYLPSVRKDLQAGLSYENAGNTTLGNIYGQQLDYNKGLYGSNVTAYGNQVELDKAKLTAMTAAGNQDTQYQIAKLDNLAKQYDIDSQVMQQVYQTMGNIFPKLSKNNQDKFVADLQLALGQGKENASLSSALFS